MAFAGKGVTTVTPCIALPHVGLEHPKPWLIHHAEELEDQIILRMSDRHVHL